MADSIYISHGNLREWFENGDVKSNYDFDFGGQIGNGLSSKHEGGGYKKFNREHFKDSLGDD